MVFEAMSKNAAKFQKLFNIVFFLFIFPGHTATDVGITMYNK